MQSENIEFPLNNAALTSGLCKDINFQDSSCGKDKRNNTKQQQRPKSLKKVHL